MGDRPAAAQTLHALYERDFRLIWWVVHGAGVRPDDVEDVMQDVFLAAHRRLAAAPGGPDRRKWLLGVARSVAHAHRRGAARRRDRLRRVPAPEPDRTVEDQLARRRAWDALWGFVDGLAQGQREVFVLSQVHGMAAPEIAEALGVKLNTVYSRLRLARTKFERHFDHPPEVSADPPLPPSATARRRTWLAIAAALPQSAAVASVGLSGLAAIVGTIGVTAVVAWGVGSRPQPTAPPQREAVASPPKIGGPAVVASATPPVAASPTTSPPQPLAAAPPAKAANPGITRRTPPRVEPVAKTTAPVPPSALQQEVDLLRRATATLDAGDASAALGLARQHARQFGATALTPERLSLEVRALCSMGRDGEARRVADAYVSAHPGDRVSARLKHTCVGQNRGASQ